MITKNGVDLSVCAYCHASLDNLSRTVDHLYPKSRGGILSNDNKVPACGDCNKLKANMNVREFSRAVNAMIWLELSSHRKRLAYLKKIRMNTEKIILVLNDDSKKKRSLRPTHDGGRENTEKEKKRP